MSLELSAVTKLHAYAFGTGIQHQIKAELIKAGDKLVFNGSYGEYETVGESEYKSGRIEWLVKSATTGNLIIARWRKGQFIGVTQDTYLEFEQREDILVSVTY